MPNKEFFPQRPDAKPKIYAYEHVNYSEHEGYIKIGYTTGVVADRVYEIEHTGAVKYRILASWSAMRSDGSYFTDKMVHRLLRSKGIKQFNEEDDNNEWFKCTVDDVAAAVVALKEGILNIENRTQTFSMRPEQKAAVDRTIKYFKSAKQENANKAPKFLWNAKMRFGKTFAAYELCKEMGLKRILVLTFKPAVETAWYDDLMSHLDFEGWQFVSNRDARNNSINMDEAYEKADKSKPIVVFGSFQDLLGTNDNGGIKIKNEFIHAINWDIIIFDEYHFGAWRENARKLFENPDEEEDFDVEKYKLEEADNAYNETFLPITTSYYLYLSGTPFRAINTGEFIEEQIYNWTYSDEQKAKEEWPNLSDFPDYVAKEGDTNPYEALPRMVMMTYKIPDSIQEIAKQGEFNEFDLNVFFSAEGRGKNAHFKYEDYVQKWLDLIRGSYIETSVDDLRLGAKKPYLPFSDVNLLNVLTHTLWFLPNVASCYAMKNLLEKKQNRFYHDYKIIVCAGTSAGIGAEALRPVQVAMDEPLESKTITLTCGKLTTGVTVKPWTGIFMLRNLKSPETYFQAAFRVQSPWEVMNDEGQREIIKQECYVFDFAINRALRQVSDYSCQLNINESNPENKVGEFINFLPVLAYDGSSMKQVDAAEILDITVSGTSATLLARRWESALLVNVDNDTLERLLANEDAMNALMRIEGFRNLKTDIETVITKSEIVKKAKRENKKLTKAKKKELTEAEKEYKSKRKMIQEKLIKFATRIPVFMYLTDYREYSLKDVITQLEPKLFKKVTGLDVKDFELLASLNVFNEALMNDAVYKFKRYEDASLEYTGIDKHTDETIGLYSTTISREDYENMDKQLSASMIVTRSEKLSDKTIPKKVASTQQKVKTKTTAPEKSDIVEKTTEKPGENNAEADMPEIEVGMKVRHKKFGTGTINSIDYDKKYLYVTFGSAEKEFQFPNAFTTHFLEIE